MTSYVTPKKNAAYKFYVALVDQSNTKLTKANPTIASGDFKVSTDGGAFANLATLPSANPASGRAIMIDLSAGEMNGDNIVVQCVDAAGAEWCDLVLNIQTTARQIDDLAYPATSGRSMVVDANGLVDANTVKVGPTGAGTAQTAGDIPARLPSALVGGKMDSHINDIAASAITAASIATDAITAAKVADGTIDAATFAAGAINAAAIAADAITAAKVADGTIDAATFSAGAINAAAIASSAITAAKFATDAIDNNAIAASAVTEIQTGLATSSALATVQADTDDIQTRIPAALAADGSIKASVQSFLGTAFTEGAAGRIAAAFKQFFNIAAPAATMDHGILVDTVTNLSNDSPGTTTLLSRLSSARAGYLDNLNVGGNVAASSEVTGLNINTRVNLLVPEEIETPDASTQVFKIRLHLYDPVGNMEAPDSTPTVTLTNQGGTDRSSRLSVASNPSTGVYTWDYTATAGDTEEQLIWLFSVVEGGVTRTYPANSYVVEESLFRFSSTDRTNLGAIKTKTDQIAFSSANRVDAQVFGMQAGTVTAAAIATDAIDADALASDAVTEIQAGLSTLNAAGVRAAVGLASANLDTQLDALPTANENADQVWDEALAGHLTSGTTGASLNAAGSAGDPWATALPGAYGPGTAGKIVGTNLDAVVSGIPAAVWAVSVRTLSSFGTLVADVAAAVWGAATRILTAGTNIALAKGTGVTGFNDLSAAQVNAEADTALADVGLTTTITGRIDAAISTRLATSGYIAPDNAGIATAAGAAASAATDAATLVSRLTSGRAANLDNLNAPISGIPTAAQNADGLLNRSIAGGADDVSGPQERSVRSALRSGRNKKEIVSNVLTVYAEDDATLAWTANVAKAPGDPITALDPN